jgi:hypothetical protein
MRSPHFFFDILEDHRSLGSTTCESESIMNVGVISLHSIQKSQWAHLWPLQMGCCFGPRTLWSGCFPQYPLFAAPIFELYNQKVKSLRRRGIERTLTRVLWQRPCPSLANRMLLGPRRRRVMSICPSNLTDLDRCRGSKLGLQRPVWVHLVGDVVKYGHDRTPWWEGSSPTMRFR